MRQSDSPTRERSARRQWMRRALATACALAAPGSFAQPARTGTVRIVVGFAAGGSSDRVARVLAPELAQRLGRSVIVENLAGANSLRAIQRVAAAEPNGDVLLMATSAIAHPDHAALQAELRPVILASISPMTLVVRSSLAVDGPAAFARWLRAEPNAVYGSAGVGNGTHLAAAELVDLIGARAIHIPYAGSPAGFADLIGGRIDFMMTAAAPLYGRQSAARVIAISTLARSRLPGFESLPTLAETIVPGFDCSLWQAMYAPGRMDDASIAVLTAQFRDILAQEPVRAALAEAGAETRAGSPAETLALVRDESLRMRRLLDR